MTTPSNEDFKFQGLKEYPTPEERAEFVILKLEQFIREGRTIDEGMSFKKWQMMARAEIALAIAEAERAQEGSRAFDRRLIFVSAAAMVTIGFWGAAVSLDNVGYLAAAVICASAGILLLLITGFWRSRKWNNYRKAKERSWSLKRIKNFNQRIKRLEIALKEEEMSLDEALQKCRQLNSG